MAGPSRCLGSEAALATPPGTPSEAYEGHSGTRPGEADVPLSKTMWLLLKTSLPRV